MVKQIKSCADWPPHEPHAWMFGVGGRAGGLRWCPGDESDLCPAEYPLCPERDRRCIQDADHVAVSPLHFNRAGFAWSDDEAREARAETEFIGGVP